VFNKLLKHYWVSATVFGLGIAMIGIGLPDTNWLSIEWARWLTIAGITFVLISIMLAINEVQKEPVLNKPEVTQPTDQQHSDEHSYQIITTQEILSMARTMLDIHGHEDITGIRLDLKSGIPPSEIMFNPCHKCNIQRNKRYTGKYIL